MSMQDFIALMTPHAVRVGQSTGLDPRLILAQSALETGWGDKVAGNNYFGVKSHGRPGGNIVATTEVGPNGPYATQDSFRGYDSPGASADDYAAFLKSNGRYGALLKAQGLDDQIAALGQSGYATDPKYADKIKRIVGQLPSDLAGGVMPPQGDAAPPLPPSQQIDSYPGANPPDITGGILGKKPGTIMGAEVPGFDPSDPGAYGNRTTGDADMAGYGGSPKLTDWSGIGKGLATAGAAFGGLAKAEDLQAAQTQQQMSSLMNRDAMSLQPDGPRSMPGVPEPGMTRGTLGLLGNLALKKHKNMLLGGLLGG